MQDLIDDIQRWLDAGDEAIALATVVSTWGSAPRRAGAKMAFTAGGLISGSVSGGCVESAVIKAGYDVLGSGLPRLLEFSVANEAAWDVGLACGGEITVFVEPLDLAAFAFEADLQQSAATGTIITIVGGLPAVLGQKLLVGPAGAMPTGLPPAVAHDLERLAGQTPNPQRVALPGPLDVFVDVIRPQPTLVMIGGGHIAVVLARLAKLVGYTTVVVDPRRAFGNATRFPDAGKLLTEWPDKALAALGLNADTAVVTLSHDPKLDDPALRVALASDVFYVGSLGSRKTHADRRTRLLEQGLTAQQVDQIHAPVGLAIGASNPEEIALAILAEVVQAYRRPNG